MELYRAVGGLLNEVEPSVKLMFQPFDLKCAKVLAGESPVATESK